MQSKGSTVSVIVVNFNGMPYLETCLSSILNQKYRDFEVILVDNCSSDGSLEYVSQRFPDLTVVTNKSNLGYTAGINSGIARASGNYIAPVNVDTEVEEDWLSSMVEFMDTNSDAGAVTPKSQLYLDRNKVGTMGLNIHITGLGFVRGLNRQASCGQKEPFQVAAISGCSFLIRREIIEQMGGLNEDNFMYYDDVDLSWMVNLMGYNIYCIPRSVIYHQYQLKMSPQKLYWLEYGRWSALLRYLRPVTLVALLPALALTEVIIGGYCLIHGPKYVWAKVRAWRAVLKNLRIFIKKRQQVQSLRKLSDFQLLRRYKLNYEWGQMVSILK